MAAAASLPQGLLRPQLRVQGLLQPQLRVLLLLLRLLLLQCLGVWLLWLPLGRQHRHMAQQPKQLVLAGVLLVVGWRVALVKGPRVPLALIGVGSFRVAGVRVRVVVVGVMVGAVGQQPNRPLQRSCSCAQRTSSCVLSETQQFSSLSACARRLCKRTACWESLR
jgi:hypothetical protein